MTPSPRLAALDLEATCIRGPGCRVVAAALVPLTERGCVDLSSALYAVEPPGEPVGETALIHGVTSNGAPGPRGPGLREVLEAALGYTLIVYGRHDVELLAGEAERRGIPWERICYIDLLAQLLRNPRRLEEARRRGGLRLEDAVEEILGFRPESLRVHNPLTDAVWAAVLYQALAARGESMRPRCLERRGRRSLSRLVSRLLGRRAPQ